MLALAIKAELPLICIEVDDPLNVEAILEATVGVKVVRVKPPVQHGVASMHDIKRGKGRVYYWEHPPVVDWSKVYRYFTKVHASLIVIAPKQKHPVMYDAGLLVTPPALIKKFVRQFSQPTDVSLVVSLLVGLSYRQAVEISKLAMAAFGEFTPRSVRRIRSRYFQTVSGLQPVSTEYDFYQPAPDLVSWLALNGRLLTLSDVPDYLVPRGILFTGLPGTGKTMGAKYIANELDLPLFLINIAQLLSKYYGESSKNLENLLRQVSEFAPCVLLIDEIEKLFVEDTEGATQRLLSQLLWWLQERPGGVLTLFTTNDDTKLPRELYRPGRIDLQILFPPLDFSEAQLFVQALSKQIGVLQRVDLDAREYTPAELTGLVYTQAKKEFLSLTKEKGLC